MKIRAGAVCGLVLAFALCYALAAPTQTLGSNVDIDPFESDLEEWQTPTQLATAGVEDLEATMTELGGKEKCQKLRFNKCCQKPKQPKFQKCMNEAREAAEKAKGAKAKADEERRADAAKKRAAKKGGSPMTKAQKRAAFMERRAANREKHGVQDAFGKNYVKPTFAPFKSTTPDPKCTINGIKSFDKKFCCAKACLQCGDDPRYSSGVAIASKGTTCPAGYSVLNGVNPSTGRSSGQNAEREALRLCKEAVLGVDASGKKLKLPVPYTVGKLGKFSTELTSGPAKGCFVDCKGAMTKTAVCTIGYAKSGGSTKSSVFSVCKKVQQVANDGKESWRRHGGSCGAWGKDFHVHGFRACCADNKKLPSCKSRAPPCQL